MPLFRFATPRLVRKYALAGIAFSACMAAQIALMTPIRHWVLTEKLTSPSASWSVHLSTSVKALSRAFEQETQGNDRAADSEIGQTKLRLCAAIDAALSSGQIFQIDLIDPERHAFLSMGGYGNRELYGSMGVASWGDEALITAFGALFSGDAGTVPAVPLPGIVPVRLGAAGAPTGAAAIRIIEDASPLLPGTFAVAEIPGAADGLTLRIVYDLDRETLVLNIVGLALALLVSLLVSLSAFHAARANALARKVTRASRAEVAYLADHDSLTGVLNRRGFEKHGAEMIEHCSQRGKDALLIQFDADKFKEINDTYSHAAGDLVLKEMAAIIGWSLPDDALVARMGGDEFCALVPHDSMGDRLNQVGLGIPAESEISLEAERRRITIRMSSGCASYPEDGETLDELIHAADLALMAVKQSGRGRMASYNRDMTTALRRRAWEIDGVRAAIGAEQLTPHYQPLINTVTGEVEGLEALSRWYHPVLGPLAPGRFTNALDDPRIGQAITLRMLDCIIGDLVRMRDMGLEPVSIGLNLGEADFRKDDLPEIISGRLADAGLTNRLVAIEATENSLVAGNLETAREMLQRFRDNGHFVALDDFGTGTSSLTLLRNVPCTSIKIDKSFVSDVRQDLANHAIVTSLTQLGHELGFKIVAEGVERADQLELLHELGVDLVQGYLFSTAVPFDQAVEIIRSRNLRGGPGRLRLVSGGDAEKAAPQQNSAALLH